MDHDLYYAASGKIVRSDAELIEMVGRWVTYDRGNSGGIRSSVRAISLPLVAKSRS
jgi:hypothetical protein